MSKYLEAVRAVQVVADVYSPVLSHAGSLVELVSRGEIFAQDQEGDWFRARSTALAQWAIEQGVHALCDRLIMPRDHWTCISLNPHDAHRRGLMRAAEQGLLINLWSSAGHITTL